MVENDRGVSLSGVCPHANASDVLQHRPAAKKSAAENFSLEFWKFWKYRRRNYAQLRPSYKQWAYKRPLHAGQAWINNTRENISR